jgi:hypothetical protein
VDLVRADPERPTCLSRYVPILGAFENVFDAVAEETEWLK